VAAVRRQIHSTDPGAVRFAWAGSVEPQGPFYARLIGSNFLIEAWIRDGHMHSILTTTDDFGAALGSM